ncbi:987_t:CDS:1, partial [Dentiscutata heterogama]
MNTLERSRITKNAPLNALHQYLSQLHEGDFYSSLESTDIAAIHLTKSECDDCVKVLWDNYVNIAKKE